MEMSDYIHVGLMTGRAVRVQATVERPLKHIRLQAQSALQTGLGVLRDSKARVFDDCQTAGEAGLKSGDTLTLQVRQTHLLICCYNGGWIPCHLG